MKKLSSIIMIALAALALNACRSNTKGSTTVADSANQAKTTDTTALKPHISVDQGDAKFAVTAAADGMAEVAAGKMAATKAVSTRVKSFANMMVIDHSKIGNNLVKIAQNEGITLPTAPDTTQKQKAAGLSKKTGRAFDRAYVDAMVDGHKKAVKLFTDASTSLKDTTLRAFAIKTLPTLKMHLDSIKAIKASMK
jgi:putative membrane protein